MTDSIAMARTRGAARGAYATGTGTLVRHILRRDRVWLPVWALAVAGFVAATVATIGDLLPTLADRQAYAADADGNPVVLLLQGPTYDLSVGAIAAQQRAGATTLFAALGSVLFMIRHTRSDEAAGRRELLGSTPVGRHAPLTAALTVVLSANVVLTALVTTLLVGAGMPLDGSLAWGLVAGCAGALGAAMAAVAAQLAAAPRVAAIGAFGLFFVTYLFRGAAELSAPWLGWLVPNGWLLRARPYGDERWWVFAATAALAALLVAAAYALSARRDLGAGLLPERLGVAAAPRWLGSPLGLAWRLQRGTLIAWAAAAAAFGLAAGFGTGDAIDRFAQSEALATWSTRMGGGDAGEVFFGLLVYVFGAYSIALCAVLLTSRLWHEESAGTAETVLSTPVGRARWALGHLACAFAAPVGLLAIVGVTAGLGTGDVPGMLALTLPLVPAVWVTVGLAVTAYGLLGRAGSYAAWSILALLVAVEFGWEVGVVSDAAFRVSPFAHVHYSALADPGAGTLLALTVVAAALTALGLTALRRRDLAL